MLNLRRDVSGDQHAQSTWFDNRNESRTIQEHPHTTLFKDNFAATVIGELGNPVSYWGDGEEVSSSDDYETEYTADIELRGVDRGEITRRYQPDGW